ncbi:MAG: DEAD/DEAH box helicase [Phycisphaerales bacterium]|nr:MAG: DEAD/DEAH box helicase [Phycisphaerales bacterium]
MTTTTFASLRLAPQILKALEQEGYTIPTPIQVQAIPHLLEGRDLLGCAQTGTGKTAAFALPLIHRMLASPAPKSRRGGVMARVLVLSPTRELATQISDSFAAYSRGTGLSGTVIFGGVGQRPQERALQRGVDVIVATPGRLLDLMEQGLLDFGAIEALVLDEADRMLDMGFIQPIRRIVAALPAKRQTLLFSATMPVQIERLAKSLLKDEVRVAVKHDTETADRIEQTVYMVGRQRKLALLSHLLEAEGVERALVFTRTKHGADKLSRKLTQAGVSADSIHGNKSQNQRQRALDRFRSGRARVLVATDVAARGIDVDGVTHVFNFDLPNEPESYVHRIGRTARAGASGVAISFCDHDERGFLNAIERLNRTRIEAITQLPEAVSSAPLETREPREAREPQRQQRPMRGPRAAGRSTTPGAKSGGGARQPRLPRQGAGAVAATNSSPANMPLGLNVGPKAPSTRQGGGSLAAHKPRAARNGKRRPNASNRSPW